MSSWKTESALHQAERDLIRLNLDDRDRMDEIRRRMEQRSRLIRIMRRRWRKQGLVNISNDLVNPDWRRQEDLGG